MYHRVNKRCIQNQIEQSLVCFNILVVLIHYNHQNQVNRNRNGLVFWQIVTKVVYCLGRNCQCLRNRISKSTVHLLFYSTRLSIPFKVQGDTLSSKMCAVHCIKVEVKAVLTVLSTRSKGDLEEMHRRSFYWLIQGRKFMAFRQSFRERKLRQTLLPVQFILLDLVSLRDSHFWTLLQ